LKDVLSQQSLEWKQDTLTIHLRKNVKKNSEGIPLDLSKLQTCGRPQLCLIFLSLGLKRRQKFTQFSKEFAEELIKNGLLGPECTIMVVVAETSIDNLEDDCFVSSFVSSSGNAGEDQKAVVCVASIPPRFGRLVPFCFFSRKGFEFEDVDTLFNGVVIYGPNTANLNALIRNFQKLDAFDQTFSRMDGRTDFQIPPVIGGLSHCFMYKDGVDHTSEEGQNIVVGFGLTGCLNLLPVVLKGFQKLCPPLSILQAGQKRNPHRGNTMTLIKSVQEVKPNTLVPQAGIDLTTYLSQFIQDPLTEELYLACSSSLDELENGSSTLCVSTLTCMEGGALVNTDGVEQGQYMQVYTRSLAQAESDAENSFKNTKCLLDKEHRSVVAAIGNVCCARNEILEDKRLLCESEVLHFKRFFPDSPYIGLMCGGEIGPCELLNGNLLSPESNGKAKVSEIHAFSNCVAVINLAPSSLGLTKNC